MSFGSPVLGQFNNVLVSRQQPVLGPQVITGQQAILLPQTPVGSQSVLRSQSLLRSQPILQSQQPVAVNQGLLNLGFPTPGLFRLQNGGFKPNPTINTSTLGRSPGQQQQQQTTSLVTPRSLLVCCIIVVVTLVVVGAVLGVILGVILDNNTGTSAATPPQAPPPPAEDPQNPVINPSPPQGSQTFNEGDIFSTGICGTQPVLNLRILGGNGATEGEWPWMGSLRDSDNRHRCGAVLISPTWILTAAHCIDEVSDSRDQLTSVVFGDLKISLASRYSKTRLFSPNNYIVHSRWSPDSALSEYDLALVYLSSSIVFTNHVLPLCLATLVPETTVYHSCFVAGWGALEEPGADGVAPYPDQLQERQIPIISTDNCRNRLNSRASDILICDDGIPNVGTCAGDSGGPLMCRSNRDSAYHLVGITSSGVGCGSTIPGFYTRISQFIQWIRVNTNAQPNK